MSAGGHRTDYVILAVVLALAGALVLFVAVRVPHHSPADSIPIRTTRSANVEGLLVYYVLLDRLGMATRRSEAPLLEHNLSDGGVLFIPDALIPLTAPERRDLLQWVSRGGVLVCAGRTAAGLSGVTGISLADQERRRRYSPGIPPGQSDLPLARKVDRLAFQKMDTLALSRRGSPSGRAARELLADSVGLRVAGRTFGDGNIIVLADTSLLANGRIDKEDNVLAAVNLAAYALARADGGEIVFDEYHVGFGAGKGGWDTMASLLFTSRPGWSVLCLALAGVLYMVYRGRRFGTRRAPGRRRRRSKLEYVDAVGASYRAARAHGLTFRLIYDWFKRRAARGVGLPPTAPAEELAALLARRSGKPPEEYRRTVRACEAAAAAPELSAHQMSRLINRLAKIESEALHADTAGK